MPAETSQSALDGKAKSVAIADVIENAQDVFAAIDTLVEGKGVMLAPPLSLPSGSLSLARNATATPEGVFLSDGVLYASSSSSVHPITSPRVRVSNVQFAQVGLGSESYGVRMTFTLVSGAPGVLAPYQYTETFTTTYALRELYD